MAPGTLFNVSCSTYPFARQRNSTGSSVTVAIYGGLGNQMFQYSMGRALAEIKCCHLQLDLRHFNTHRAFSYGLRHFNINAVSGTEHSLPPSKQERIRYLTWRYLLKNPRMIREEHLGFSEMALQAPGSVYLKGYWQSYRYFIPIAEQLRQELTPVNPPQGKNAELLEVIGSQPSIAVHIRRGDYISNPQANKFHGTCPPQYFERGIKWLLNQMSGRPTVFVFSDDHEWTRNNIRIDCNTVFVSHNDGQAAHEDLRLMAMCNHQVISNSTFSWWAAWLNPNPLKMVVAPTRWFADPHARNDDLIPEDWTRIDSSGSVATAERFAA